MEKPALKPYPTYKPAGVPWLQQVPEHWEVRRLGSLGHFFKGRGVARADIKPTGLPALTYGDLYTRYSVVTTALTKFTSEAVAKVAQPIQSGDLLFAASGETDEDIGKTVLYAGGVPGYAGGDIIILRQQKANSHFLSWALNSEMGLHQKSQFARGEIIVHISSSSLKLVVVPVPPPDEQHLIVRYLHALDAKVKRYIRTKRKLIAALQEQKKAIIQRAVTRGLPAEASAKAGLDPKVKLKPSGVEWLGEVPEHWEVSMVKRHFRVELGKMLDAQKHTEGHRKPYMNAANIHWDRFRLDTVKDMFFKEEELERFRLRKGDLLVTEGGATMGRSAIWNDEIEECYYQKSSNRARPTGHLSSRFLLYWMMLVTKSGIIDATSSVATFGHLTKEKLSRLPLVVPPPEEEQAIVAHIDAEIKRLDRPEQRLHDEINVMQEYHTRLIADVVTGAVDVRAAAKAMATEVEEVLEEEPLSMAAEGEAEYGVEE